MYAVEVMNLALAQQTLRTRLLTYLDGLEPTLRLDVRAALEVEGKLLHQPISELDGRWALLPFCLAQDLQEVAEGAFVGSGAACDVALAMECVVCATDLLDDVMDDDLTPLEEQLGMARVLNVALTLITLSQRMLLALLDLDLPVMLPTRLMDMMQNAILRASAGQQQDLLAERRLACDLTREECLEIAAAKAGALLSLACQMGALCAGLAEQGIKQCAEIGCLLGIAAQLDNDAHDLSSLLQSQVSWKSQKSDLARGKKTLPIILAASSLQKTTSLEAHSIDFQRMELLAEEERNVYCVALREGILATWGIALLYRQRAREALETLVGERSISSALQRILGLDIGGADARGAGVLRQVKRSGWRAE